MSDFPRSSSGAPESALARHYEWSVALATLLERVHIDPAASVALELIEDVSVHNGDSVATTAKQLKHYKMGSVVTSYSNELWRSIRAWIDLFKREDSRLDGCRFELHTTSNVQESSAITYLRPGTRNIEKVRQELVGVANTSKTRANLGAYAAFRDLGALRQSEFLQRVFIYDGSARIDEVIAGIRPYTRWACEENLLPAFEQRLLGWWVKRVIAHLQGEDDGFITGFELQAHFGDMRDQFGRSSLFIDEDIFDLAIPEDVEDRSRIFLRQLQLIAADNNTFRNAISDYYCAYVQRSRWIDENIVLAKELERYETRLVREWRRHFERQRGLCSGATASDSVAAGKSLHDTMHFDVVIPIRPDVTDMVIQRGTCLMLADVPILGWHPDFVELLKKTLSEAS